MTTKQCATHLPQPSLRHLIEVTPIDLAVGFVAAQKDGRTGKADAVKALSEFFPAEQVLADAVTKGRLEERGGLLHEVPGSKPNGSALPRTSMPWLEVKRAFALNAVGATPGGQNGKRVKRELAAIALRQLYSLENLSHSPSRAEVRCELLRRVVAGFDGAFTVPISQTSKSFKFDPMSRSLYLGFAGLSSGSVLDADAALLSAALGGPARNVAELAATIIRAALALKAMQRITREEAFNLDGFAESVRELARKLETKPYAGRVAIAQVYDAGLEEGLDLGSLDDFKMHLAEAAREGKLDLERYDITGPLDAGLKERSRLRLGRDERHFIVNQWI